MWPFKECTSHGAMDGDNSLLDILGAGAVPRDYLGEQCPLSGCLSTLAGRPDESPALGGAWGFLEHELVEASSFF